MAMTEDEVVRDLWRSNGQGLAATLRANATGIRAE
jgi:hypothetical protein